jgi:hypothetical protein
MPQNSHWSHRFFTKFKKNEKDMVSCDFCKNETVENATRQGTHLLVNFILTLLSFFNLEMSESWVGSSKRDQQISRNF